MTREDVDAALRWFEEIADILKWLFAFAIAVAAFKLITSRWPSDDAKASAVLLPLASVLTLAAHMAKRASMQIRARHDRERVAERTSYKP